MYPGPLTPSTAPFQCGGRGSTLNFSQQAKLLTIILMLSPDAISEEAHFQPRICDLFWSKTHSLWSQVTVEEGAEMQGYPQICFHTQLCITTSIPLPLHPFPAEKSVELQLHQSELVVEPR